MIDIGLAPDYRSGVIEILECYACQRGTNSTDTCPYCGAEFCCLCYEDHLEECEVK